MYGPATALLAAAFIASGGALAQNTNSNGIRSGYGGHFDTQPAKVAPASSSSTRSSGSPNLGTGRGRTEGAMGLSPQLQRELGIRRQQ
jgi:hypothetical protein